MGLESGPVTWVGPGADWISLSPQEPPTSAPNPALLSQASKLLSLPLLRREGDKK